MSVQNHTPGVTGLQSASVRAVRLRAISGEMGHRKLARHDNEPGHCRELTFFSCRRMPLLSNHVWLSILSVILGRADASRVPGSYIISKRIEPA